MTKNKSTKHHDPLLDATSRVVSAYINSNHQEANDLDALVQKVYSAFANLSDSSEQMVNVMNANGKTAQVSIEESVQPDYLICLEDGKKLKMLKRYLKTNYGITPEEYRERWNLPSNYPMVAPEYAKRRSQLAKKIGLGKQPKGPKPLVKATSNGHLHA